MAGTDTVGIAVIYHSETGNTRQMADLVREGCESVAGVEARCMPVENVDEEFVSGAAAVIFGSPTYEGSCSWQMKEYLDTQPQGLGGNWPASLPRRTGPVGVAPALRR